MKAPWQTRMTFALLLLLVGCHRSIDGPDDVVGVYHLNTQQVTDSLEVRRNGEYVHYYRAPGSAVIIERGRWELDEIEGRPHIAFHDYVPRYRSSVHADLPQQRGIWPALVEKSFRGSLRLSVNSDLGLYYERVPTR